MNAILDREFRTRPINTNETYNPAAYNIQPKKISVKGETEEIVVRAACIACEKKCFVAINGECIPKAQVFATSWKDNSLGGIFHARCALKQN